MRQPRFYETEIREVLLQAILHEKKNNIFFLVMARMSVVVITSASDQPKKYLKQKPLSYNREGLGYNLTYRFFSIFIFRFYFC